MDNGCREGKRIDEVLELARHMGIGRTSNMTGFAFHTIPIYDSLFDKSIVDCGSC